MRKITNSIIFVFLVSTSIPAQYNRPELTSYLPLQIGNEWSYGGILDGVLRLSTILDTAVFDDEVFYCYRDSSIWEHPHTSNRYLRWDSTGQLFYPDGLLWIDFTQEVGDTLSTYFSDIDSSNYINQIVLSDTFTANTPAGIFDSCIVVLFDHPDMIDEERTYIFAPGVGIVEFYIENGRPASNSLLYAEVNGHFLSSPRSELVASYNLLSNYPNPFNSITSIEYHIKNGSQVEIKVINLLGQTVTTLVTEFQNAGHYKIQWDAGDISSGIYFCTIRAGGFVQSNKMVLLK